MIRMMKANEEFDIVRVHSDEHLMAKTFDMLIGLILRNEIFVRTRELRKSTKNKNDYTTTSCMRELNCISATILNNTRYANVDPLTKKQKSIIKTLGFTENEINQCLEVFNREKFSIKN